MDDVISRRGAIDAVNCKLKKWSLLYKEYCSGIGVKYSDVIEMLSELPSVQPEIIYCRECRYWKTDHPTANGYHCCHRIHNAFPMREDDFCSRAERREE